MIEENTQKKIVRDDDMVSMFYRLRISMNEGYDPKFQENDANKPWILSISLVHGDEESEITSFNFAYSNIEQIVNSNLYLLYQTLAGDSGAMQTGHEAPKDASPNAPANAPVARTVSKQTRYLLAAGAKEGA